MKKLKITALLYFMFVIMLNAQTKKNKIEIVNLKNDTIETSKCYTLKVYHKNANEAQLSCLGAGIVFKNLNNGTFRFVKNYTGKLSIAVSIKGKSLGVIHVYSKGGHDYVAAWARDSINSDKINSILSKFPTDSFLYMKFLVKMEKFRMQAPYILEVINETDNSITSDTVYCNFIIPLKYDMKYKLKIGNEACNYRYISIDTHAPRKKWVLESDIEMEIDGNSYVNGFLIYDRNTDYFILKN
ncbi:MAG: hypothetical protein IPM51_00410 [Sphingobacteriaceae bacterium]|nr:hypothetical protein [Sphingobacteriaceae bacterium]